MDYNLLLDLATDLGYELAMSGAETFRVEDTIQRILKSYDVEAEVFAIPNYLIVSIITSDGKPITRMRRIGFHGTNLDAVERLNAFSRGVCETHPAPTTALDWLKNTIQSVKGYRFSTLLLGDFLGAAGFGVLFGCNALDTLWSGLCGILIGLVNKFSDAFKVNPFFSTFAASFVMALAAYSMNVLGIVQNSDTVNIGALMILVPGLLFTNALRDIIYGDINSGINRIVQVILIAVAISTGTAFAWNAVSALWASPKIAPALSHSLLITSIAAFVGCIGFSILFNIHGAGGLLCAAGGVLTWVIYSCVLGNTGNELFAYFWATAFAALYSEIMARMRKYPAISYLVVSIFPLIPGAGVYYTMRYALDKDMQMFATQGMHTAAIAGVMAVSILLAATLIRVYTTWHAMQKK